MGLTVKLMADPIDNCSVAEVISVAEGSAMHRYDQMTAKVFPASVLTEGCQIVQVNSQSAEKLEEYLTADRLLMIARKWCWYQDGVAKLDRFEPLTEDMAMSSFG